MYQTSAYFTLWRRNLRSTFCFFLLLNIFFFFSICSAHAAPVTLTWDKSADNRVVGYKIYYKTDQSGAPYSGTNLEQGDSPIKIETAGLSDGDEPRVTLTGLELGKTYYIAATAYDQSGNESKYSNEVEYTVTEENEDNGSVIVFTSRVSNGSDDAEEQVSNGNVSLTSDDLEMAYNVNRGNQITGIRFATVQIPPKASITKAYLEFTAKKAGSEATNLNISMEASDDAATFTSGTGNVSGRTHMSTAIIWPNVASWTSVGGTHRTPDLTSLVQAAVNRDGWRNGNAMAFIISGSGLRSAYSFEGPAGQAPLLYVEYSVETQTTDHTIVSSAQQHGSIDPNGDVAVAHGGNQAFTITPDAGYKISDVLVDGASMGPRDSYTFNSVTADHAITVEFINITYSIAVHAGSNGNISPAGTQSVAAGSSRSFTITADDGYHIGDVQVDNVSVGAVTTYSFDNINENHTLRAEFAVNTYTLTTTSSANGSISPSGPITVTQGSSQTFNFIPHDGYEIGDINVDGVSKGTGNSYTFSNVNKNHALNVSFVAKTNGSDDTGTDDGDDTGANDGDDTGSGDDNTDSNGGDNQSLIVLEAEAFTSSDQTATHYWAEVSSPGSYSGDAAMRALPDQGERISSNYTTNSPCLKFDVTFENTGRYYVWVRGYARGNDNSLHAGLNGNAVTSAANMSIPVSQNWEWSNRTGSGAASLLVESTGLQTLNIWMREDGLVLDKIVLSADPDYIPSGLGPENEAADNSDNSGDSSDSGDSDGSDPVFTQSDDALGLLVIETESFDDNKAAGSHAWSETTSLNGFSGDGAMGALPDTDVRISSNYAVNSPRLTYRVKFVKSGTHYLWLRGFARRNGNSAHAGMNETEVVSSRNITFKNIEQWGWAGALADGSPVVLSIPEAGEYTINLWMREDGLVLDKLLLTSDPTYQPTGLGPQESSR